MSLTSSPKDFSKIPPRNLSSQSKYFFMRLSGGAQCSLLDRPHTSVLNQWRMDAKMWSKGRFTKQDRRDDLTGSVSLRMSQGKLLNVTCCHLDTNRQLEDEKTALIWYTWKTFISQLGVQCARYHMSKWDIWTFSNPMYLLWNTLKMQNARNVVLECDNEEFRVYGV